MRYIIYQYEPESGILTEPLETCDSIIEAQVKAVAYRLQGIPAVYSTNDYYNKVLNT